MDKPAAGRWPDDPIKAPEREDVTVRVSVESHTDAFHDALRRAFLHGYEFERGETKQTSKTVRAMAERYATDVMTSLSRQAEQE